MKLLQVAVLSALLYSAEAVGSHRNSNPGDRLNSPTISAPNVNTQPLIIIPPKPQGRNAVEELVWLFNLENNFLSKAYSGPKAF